MNGQAINKKKKKMNKRGAKAPFLSWQTREQMRVLLGFLMTPPWQTNTKEREMDQERERGRDGSHGSGSDAITVLTAALHLLHQPDTTIRRRGRLSERLRTQTRRPPDMVGGL